MQRAPAGVSSKWAHRVRAALSAILFAVLFWLIFVFTVGTFIFLGGLPDSWYSETAGNVLGLLFLLPLILGGIYGWYRGRRNT